jgi:hypothetical protein
LDNPYRAPRADVAGPATIAARNKLYRVSAVGVATFFGAVLSGGIVMAINYQRLNMPDRARMTLILSVLATLGVLIVNFTIPPSWQGANVALILLQSFSMIYIAKGAQEKHIRAHIEQGGAVASVWAAFGIGVATSVVLLGALAAVVVLLPNLLS